MGLPVTELARALRERRRALGLTRTRLADQTGLTASELARWERAEAIPTPEQITLLAEAVGMDDSEVQAWLEVSARIDLTGPEVAVQLVDAPGPPSDPFLKRVMPQRSGGSLFDRVRSALQGRRPIGTLDRDRPRVVAPARPAPKADIGLVRRPVVTRRELPSVFPDATQGAYDPVVRVYSTAPSTYPGPGEVRVYALRRIRTAIVLIVLGLVLWWALGALGQGFNDVLDLFRTPVDSGLVP